MRGVAAWREQHQNKIVRPGEATRFDERNVNSVVNGSIRAYTKGRVRIQPKLPHLPSIER